MIYQNPVYGIFNQSFIEAQLRQHHHKDQIMKSVDCANKLKDFLDSTDKIDPAYQNMALDQCCLVIGNYMKRHGML